MTAGVSGRDKGLMSGDASWAAGVVLGRAGSASRDQERTMLVGSRRANAQVVVGRLECRAAWPSCRRAGGLLGER